MTKHSPTPPEADDTEPMLDWGLRELLQPRPTKDLTASVHAALKRAQAAPAGSSPRRSWLLAAGILLGAAVVLTVALWQPKPDREQAITPQLPWPEKPHAVHSVKDALAVPLDARAVTASGVDDAVIEALTRLRHLEVLVIHKPANETFGLGLKMAGQAQPKYITNACWRHFAKFTKLRALRLSGTSLIARIRTGSSDDVITALEHLPLLEELSLRMLDCGDAVLERLPRLRNLRRLNLDFNHGFTQAGVQALLRCQELRSLSLEGCQQLHGNWLEQLAALPKLEILNLRSIDHMNWRAGTAEPDDEEGRELQRRARRVADSLSVGVNDGTLRSLATAPRLRVLHVSNGYWTTAGLSALGQSASLRELDMFGGQVDDHAFVQHLPRALTRLEVCSDFTDGFCRAVRENLPNLRHLNIAACDRISDRGLAELLQIESLRILDMRQMHGLTAAAVDDLDDATQIEHLDLRHNDWLTKQHVVRLQAALRKLKKLETSF